MNLSTRNNDYNLKKSKIAIQVKEEIILKEYFDLNDFESIKKEYDSLLQFKNTEKIVLLKSLLNDKKKAIIQIINSSYSKRNLS
jgi:hypothetical protein